MIRQVAVVASVTAALAAACSPAARRGPDPDRRDVPLPLDTATIEGRVPAAATLETLLRDNQVDPVFVPPLTAAVRAVFNPRRLQADRAFQLTRGLDGLFREFRYQIDNSKFLRVVFRDRTPEGQPEFDVSLVPYPREVSIDAVRAEITRERPSLIAAFDAAGESVPLPLALADIFSGEIDFNSDLQQGDSASVLFERIRRDGQPVWYGDVEAAVLENEGRRLVGIRFTGGDGRPAWYDEQGHSLKRQFLKSPLPFEHVTSGFSRRRLHPLFGDFRAHLGVDYAAPVGTPVVAVADGTVESAGWSGNSGRLVVLRHADGYETLYLHLSSFAQGIRPGVRVVQGQLIGRVGMSGAATGPHLDFRIKRHGVHMNPVTVHSRMPPGEPIAPDQLAAFRETRDQALQQLQALSAVRSAATATASNRP